MSNIAIFNGAAVPAFARNNALSETAKALMGGNLGNTTKRISIKGGVFRLVAGGKEVASIEDRHLDVIIVKAAPKVSRIFYAGTYDKDATATAPDCWSNDGEKPDASAGNKQAVNCMSCPQNAAGSGQGNSRACRFQQRLAVVLANDPSGDVLQLTLPATSVFGKEDGDKRPLQAFVRHLAVQNPPINPEQIITRMKFDTKAEAPKLHFTPVRWLTDDEYETVVQQGNSEDAARAVNATTAQTDGVKPLALAGTRPMGDLLKEEEQRAAKPKAKAKPEPVAETVVETGEETAEPEVRKAPSKVTAVPAAKSKLADIVSDWDDE
jgi:hypothetical protein